MNLNKVIIAGRVVADPEVRMTGSGTVVANIRMATNRYFTKDGQRPEETEFHNIVAWGRTAEVVRDYLKKGQLALIEGRLQTRSWEGKDGQKRWTTEIVTERLQLGPKSAGGDSSANSPTETSGQASAPAAKPKSSPRETDKLQKSSEGGEEDIPVIDEDTVMDFGDEEQKKVDPKDIPF